MPTKKPGRGPGFSLWRRATPGARSQLTIDFSDFRATARTFFEAGFALNIIFCPVNGLMPSRAFVAGFSFGSFVAYRAAALRPAVRLYTIAPPVGRFDFAVHPVPAVPWIVRP